MRANPPVRAWLAAVVVLLAAMAPQLQAAEPVIDLIPADTELLVGLNVRSLMDSPLFNAIADQTMGRKRFEGEIQKTKTMSGVDLTRDINRVYWFGRLGKVARGEGPPEGVLLAEGRFNKEALVALAREERGYGTVEAGGRTIHVWTQGGQSRGACFLSDSRLLICEDRDCLAAYLETLAGHTTAAGKKENIRGVLGELDRSTFVVFGVPAERPRGAASPAAVRRGFKPGPTEAALLRGVDGVPPVQSVRLVVGLEAEDVVADARLVFQDAEAAKNVFAIAAGALAFLRLATTDDPDARAFLDAIAILPGEDGRSVHASIRIGNDAIIQAIREGAPQVGAGTGQMVGAAQRVGRALKQVQGVRPVRRPEAVVEPELAAPDVSAELEKIQRQLDALQKTLEQMKAIRAKSETAAPESK